MIHRILPLLSAVALFVPLAGCVARAGGGITNVIPVQLQEGANLVPHLAPDGRQGLVVEGRQPDALAPLIMTMLPRAEGQRGWDVVDIEAADGSRLPTLDARGRAVLFARAKVGGIPATLLFVAVPDPGDAAPLGDAAPHADPDAAPAGRRDQRPLRAESAARPRAAATAAAPTRWRRPIAWRCPRTAGTPAAAVPPPDASCESRRNTLMVGLQPFERR